MAEKLRSQTVGFWLVYRIESSIEKFKAYGLAKVHNFLSEIMKKSCGKFLPRFDALCICKRQQNTPHSEFLLELTKTNRSAKATRVLSSKFVESSTTLLDGARRHKWIQNTHNNIVLTKVNFGSKFVLKTDLYSVGRSAQTHWITSLSLRSITRSATAGLQLVSEKFSQKLKFTGYRVCPR